MSPLARKITYTVTAVVGAFLAIRLLGLLMLWPVYSWFFQTIRNASGMPDLLTGAVSILFTAIAMLVLPIMLSAIFWRHNTQKVLIVAGALSVWLVVLYFISQPKAGQYFNPMTGQAMFKYSKTPDGRIELFPLGYEYHPRYGNKLQIVTPEVIKLYEGNGAQVLQSYFLNQLLHTFSGFTGQDTVHLESVVLLPDKTVFRLSHTNGTLHDTRLSFRLRSTYLVDDFGNMYKAKSDTLDWLGSTTIVPYEVKRFDVVFPKLPQEVKKFQFIYNGHVAVSVELR